MLLGGLKVFDYVLSWHETVSVGPCVYVCECVYLDLSGKVRMDFGIYVILFCLFVLLLDYSVKWEWTVCVCVNVRKAEQNIIRRCLHVWRKLFSSTWKIFSCTGSYTAAVVLLLLLLWSRLKVWPQLTKFIPHEPSAYTFPALGMGRLRHHFRTKTVCCFETARQCKIYDHFRCEVQKQHKIM